MKVLIELVVVFFQVLSSWCYVACLTFGFRFLIVILSGIFAWIVGLFFGETILSVLAQLGITGFSMAQIGVFLGFIGCFFVPIINNYDKKNEAFPQKHEYTK